METDTETLVAPYGRSCEVCVKAKCKCLFRPDGDKCERCTRLNKDCKQPQARRRRAPAKKNEHAAADATRTARLEEKLDRVLESLKPRQRSGPISPASISDGVTWPITDGGNVDTHHHSSLSNVDVQPSFRYGDAHDQPSFTPDAHASLPEDNMNFPLAEAAARQFANSRPARAWRLANVSPAAAETRLTEFRTQYLSWFPFVYIPPSTTSEQLRNDRPFLWLNVMLLTSRSTSVHMRMGEIIRRELAEGMVVDSEKSLDLLLGLLIFMGWYFVHCQCSDSSVRLSLSLLTQLAISLVFDLQLNKRDLKPAVYTMLGVSTHKNLRFPYPRTLEAKRAGLAIFILSSQLSVYIQRLDPLRWTPYFSDNLKELEQNPEWHGDGILAQQVRMHLVVYRIYTISWSDGLEDDDTSDNQRLSSPAYVQMLRAQLDKVKSNLTPDQQANPLLTLTYYITTISLHDLAPKAATPSIHTISNRTTILTAVKNLYSTFLALPHNIYHSLSFPLTCQLMNAIAIAFDLATLDEPGWDKTLVRSEVDVPGMLERLINAFEQAAPFLSTPQEGQENACEVYARFLRMAFAGVKARLAEGEQGEDVTLGVGGAGTDGVGFDLEFLDNPIFWNFQTGFEGTLTV